MPSRLRVAAGFAVGLLALALARPTRLSVLLGLPWALAGEALRLWASGHIKKTQQLATGGPYAHTRNPLYLGSLSMSLGFATAAASPWVVLAAALYFAAFFPSLIREEASFIAQKFGDDYTSWARVVPAFLPRLTPAGPRATRFEWRQVGVNREWRTALAILVVAALLFAKT